MCARGSCGRTATSCLAAATGSEGIKTLTTFWTLSHLSHVTTPQASRRSTASTIARAGHQEGSDLLQGDQLADNSGLVPCAGNTGVLRRVASFAAMVGGLASRATTEAGIGEGAGVSCSRRDVVVKRAVEIACLSASTSSTADA